MTIRINQDLTNPQILTPVGRLVQGDCFRPQTQDTAGQPTVKYFIAIAIPKNLKNGEVNQDLVDLKNKIKALAKADFPTLFDKKGECIKPDFAFKMVDGDSEVPDTNAIRPCDRGGYKGHWIIKFTSKFAPKCVELNTLFPILDQERIKHGYYIRVHGTVKGNGSSKKPGVYLNLAQIQLVDFGPEIVRGHTAAVFSENPIGEVPAGASSVPVVPAGPADLPMPSDADDFLNPAREYLDAQGIKYTHDQFLKAGYSEEQIGKLQKV